MNDLISTLGTSFLSKNIESIATSIWLPKEITAKAVKVALPAVMNWLAKNTESKTGAESLFNALKSHDGSSLKDIASLAKDPEASKASWILGHVFGSKQSNIEQEIASSAWIDLWQAQSILKVVAPMVMGWLWKAQDEGMDMNNMISMLWKASGGNNILTSFLDKDWDGDVKDDLLKMGMNHLKKKFFG